MTKEFIGSNPQNDFVNSVEDALRSTDKAVHLRVLGEPGIGKTKLALEATRANDLQSHVLYCRKPSLFLDNPLSSDILSADNNFSVLLIVDECSPEYARELWNLLKHRGARIKLITIYNDFDDTHHDTILEAPSLSNEDIVKIIVSYNIPEREAHNWADFCSGSPRVAHILGENLMHNRDNILGPTATVPNLWERYIAGKDKSDSQNVQDRIVVLKHIAMFKRFGYGSPFAEDFRKNLGTNSKRCPAHYERAL